jgi:hypothetical protein
MKCSETERNIYLYNELTARERAETDEHVKTCASCSHLMEHVVMFQNVIKSYQSHTPPMTSDAQLRQRILDALHKDAESKKARWRWFAPDLKLNALRYGMAVLSLFLAVMFIGEYSSGSEHPNVVKEYRLIGGEKAELNLASFNAALLESKELNRQPSTLLSHCVNTCLQLQDPGCKECANKFAKPF